MNFLSYDALVRWLGGFLAFFVLGILLYGIWKGSHRQAGRTVGIKGAWLRSPVFYFIASALFFGLAWLGWKALPVHLSSHIQNIFLFFGALFYFPGMILLLWARLTLGKEYFVSTGMGAQLFKDQQLVTTGPYAMIRHPMYAGLMLAALGSLLIYMTWTTLYFACMSPLLFLRARREEEALAAEFGERWQTYAKHVRAFVPRLRK